MVSFDSVSPIICIATLMEFFISLEKVVVGRQVGIKDKVFHTFCYSAARRTTTLPIQLLLIIHKVIYFS